MCVCVCWVTINEGKDPFGPAVERETLPVSTTVYGQLVPGAGPAGWNSGSSGS